MYTSRDSETKVFTPSLEQLELRVLMNNLRKSVELYFLMNRDVGTHQRQDVLVINKNYNTSFYQIQTSATAILQHGLRPLKKLLSEQINVSASDLASSSSSSVDDFMTCYSLQKFIDDFEWVFKNAQARHSVNDDVNDCIKNSTLFLPLSATSAMTVSNIKQFLFDWTLRNLKAKCLCSCLEILVNDKELLEKYYDSGAFLRNETFANALFICVSALELKRCIILSQIEPSLYGTTLATPEAVKHMRSSSHPNFFISSSTISKDLTPTDGVSPQTPNLCPPSKVFPTFRKTRSFPVLINCTNTSGINCRQRCKTMAAASEMVSEKDAKPTEISDLTIAITASPSWHCSVDTTPSTSAASKSNLEFYTNSTSTSHKSESSTPAERQIHLIKCDIKVWTDQSYHQQQQESHQQKQQNQSTPQQVDSSLPQSVQAKSMSPINSFLSSLFSTPPSYTNWSNNPKPSNLNAESNDENAAYPCNAYHQKDNINSIGVFDSFLPQYGKKLNCRNAQNLFEDGVSSLHQKCYDGMPNIATELSDVAEEKCNNNSEDTKNNQSLTAFLKMSQLSRNNTDLEKENAHFRISEAIISAIEHIKWAKTEPVKSLTKNETATAMDCLRNEQKNESDLSTKTEVNVLTEEHIPYAELGESLDPISAEVVGLCLISKFSDQHLPKVSTLKWLVSEEETKQCLLPMPDNCSSANPDDNIMPSVTRGTKYWAPPRQQIIFTDHPTPNRKELIQKQNNRCAGCGMRVAPQYLNSFRYCTYLGKYHCTGCHRNQISATPAKILQMWDFKCYPVCVFAYRLLEQMFTFPLFYVPDLNPVLYTRSKVLLTARTKRVQLQFVKDFIKACRFATVEQQHFQSIPDYIVSDPDTWSMSDFIDANNKSLHNFIDKFIQRCENHIFNCVLCSAHGFICEHCRVEDVIYPWQNKVFRCDHCGACFHLSCWKSKMDICCRCQRIKNRRDDTIREIALESY